MCRLLSIVANKEVDFRFSLSGGAPRNVRTQSLDNPDGWGVAFFSQEGQSRIVKAPRKAEADALFNETAKSGFGRILLAHVRKASSGKNIAENTHPFVIGNWVFAHNGTIHDKTRLLNYVDPKTKTQIRGDTDSEIYFALIMTQLKADHLKIGSEAAIVLDSLSSAVQKVREVAGTGDGLNFLLCDGESLYAYKNGRPLYVLKRDPQEVAERQLYSSETGVLLRWKKSARERAIIITSEKLTEAETWESLPENAMICVDRNLTIHKRISV